MGFSIGACLAKDPDVNKRNNTQFKVAKKKAKNPVKLLKSKQSFFKEAAKRKYKGYSCEFQKKINKKTSRAEAVSLCPAMRR